MENKALKIRVAFWINLTLSVLAFIIFLNTVETNTTWKTIASGIGFLGFFGVTIMVFRELLKVKKC